MLEITKIVRWKIVAWTVFAGLALSTTTYFIGRHDGAQQCEKDHKAQANEDGINQLNADIAEVKTQADLSNAAGTKLATVEQATQTHTQVLTKKVIEYVPIIANDSCAPGPDLVRTWNEANRGIDDAPAAPAERDGAVP